MSQAPFEQVGNLRIGTVEFVSPDRIEAVLDIEAPDSVALNAGAPRPFPRVNGYLLIPVDEGFLAGQVEWLTVERSAFPKRRGMQDFGLVDLPYPLRKLRLNPLGMLREEKRGCFAFRRGSDALPSIGEAVLMPTEAQLRSIVESGEYKRVKIGTSPIAGDAEVHVDPDRLYGRHLAVLGNTGSGKSCSVAGLIRWSVEQSAQNAVSGRPNARFIILDPNGEYSRAFGESNPPVQTKIFMVNPDTDERLLRVPLWLWNSAEWCSFTQASLRAQRPTLMYALRFVRDGDTTPPIDSGHIMHRFLRTLVSIIQIEQSNGSPWGQFPRPKSFFEKLEKWESGIEAELEAFQGERYGKLQALVNKLDSLCQPRRIQYPHYDFTLQEVQDLLEVTRDACNAFGDGNSDIIPSDVDAPLPFDETSLIRSVEAAAEILNTTDYVEPLLLRIQALLTDVRIKPIIGSTPNMTLEQWIGDYVGDDQAQSGHISIIDLSLVPPEIVHIITAVIARMVFEFLQRYVKLNGVALPTVLVMEEAHTFVKRYRYRDDIENIDAAVVCCQVFERIAREGRKFGLGLVLSSQRPSELSPAVLSQCNTFLLHQISNDRDQDIVHRLVPDNLKGLLRELPSLPSQNAILLGWASELPVLVKMNDLPRSQQPRSDDPEFWKVWTRQEERPTNWGEITRDWTGGTEYIETGDGHTGDDPVDDLVGAYDGNDEDLPF